VRKGAHRAGPRPASMARSPWQASGFAVFAGRQGTRARPGCDARRARAQVHDEVILEGPAESAAEAQALVVRCMERPFAGRNPLTVALVVDSNVAGTWYDAK